MTDDFRKGYSRLQNVLDMIKVKITDPAGTPESQKALNVLTATIQIDTEETERA